jgi:drug/metabolite transporter (DMT)-like permease
MRKRTIAVLTFGTLLAALVCGVAGVVMVAMAYPGVKGPLVSDDGLAAGFAIGAVIGGGLVVGFFRLRTRRRRRPPWMDGDSA